MADGGNPGGVRRLPVRQRETGRPRPSQRQRAALQGREARPEPRGSLATALPPPVKGASLRSVAAPPLTAGASWLTWRYRLRGRMTASISPGKVCGPDFHHSASLAQGRRGNHPLWKGRERNAENRARSPRLSTSRRRPPLSPESELGEDTQRASRSGRRGTASRLRVSEDSAP